MEHIQPDSASYFHCKAFFQQRDHQHMVASLSRRGSYMHKSMRSAQQKGHKNMRLKYYTCQILRDNSQIKQFYTVSISFVAEQNRFD